MLQGYPAFISLCRKRSYKLSTSCCVAKQQIQNAIDHMDDDFFDDDDGLDDLPPNTLQELENRARLSTQHAQPLADAQKAASSDYGFGDDEEVIDLDARPHANVLTARQPSQHASAHPLSQRRVPLPTTASDEVTQRERWRAQRYGATNQHRLPAFKPPRASIAIGQAFQASSTQTSQANGRVAEPEAIENHDDSPNPDIEALRARITAVRRKLFWICWVSQANLGNVVGGKKRFVNEGE